MATWRWDQGRLQYFAYDSIKRVASALVAIDGAPLGDAPDALREPLEAATDLPFLPKHYKVLRNYKRFFECAMLATDNHGVLAVTDICRRVAADNASLDVDAYLSLLIPRLAFPFPAFELYSATQEPIYPLIATLKYVLAAYNGGAEASMSLDDVFSFIVGNHMTGTEPVDSYLTLKPTTHEPKGAERRQVREMLIFASQSSFLKWHKDRLFLDILAGDAESVDSFSSMIEPMPRTRNADKAIEILLASSLGATTAPPFIATTRRQAADVVFTEGRPVRATHLRTERSPYLRRAVFSQKDLPYLCDMCGCDPKYVYPWTDNILEVHHLLPLSSALTITLQGTSLKDVVAICPNCHRSVHTYYKTWLNDNGLDDFRSRDEVAGIYNAAKGSIQQ